MANKAKYLVVGLGALFIAGAALATQDPPPPGQSEEAIIAWAKAAKLTDDTANPPASWSIMGALDEGLLWSSVKAPDAAGIAKVGVRLERFRPNAGVRSEAEMFDLNCQTQQIKPTHNAAYAEHNFGGAKTDRPLNGAWAPVASHEIVSAFKDDACKASARTAAAPAGAPAININDPAAIRAWLNEKKIRDRDVGTTSGQWSILGANNEGMVMSILGKRNTTTRTAFMIVRTERFSPLTGGKLPSSLSETSEFEINCQNNRIRQTGTIWFTEHNMMGRNNGEQKLTEWAPLAEHPILAKAGTDLCKEFQVRRDFQT